MPFIVLIPGGYFNDMEIFNLIHSIIAPVFPQFYQFYLFWGCYNCNIYIYVYTPSIEQSSMAKVVPLTQLDSKEAHP